MCMRCVCDVYSSAKSADTRVKMPQEQNIVGSVVMRLSPNPPVVESAPSSERSTAHVGSGATQGDTDAV